MRLCLLVLCKSNPTIFRAGAQPKYVDKILNLQQNNTCYLIGTLYKDMKLKPNILDEYHAREVCLVLYVCSLSCLNTMATLRANPSMLVAI